MPKGVYPRKPRTNLRPLPDRFWAKVAKTEGCWLWTAAHSRRRNATYGHFGVGRRVRMAHRVSWMLSNGPIPGGAQILHRCDTPLCVRPDHLFLGTQADNVRDMWAKGRGRAVSGAAHPARRPGARVGERNGRARLTPDEVRRIREMRADGMEYREIAAHFGVATPTVQHVVSRKNWAHIV